MLAILYALCDGVLDLIDLRLILELLSNGAICKAELARQLGTNEGVLRYRLRRLSHSRDVREVLRLFIADFALLSKDNADMCQKFYDFFSIDRR